MRKRCGNCEHFERDEDDDNCDCNSYDLVLLMGEEDRLRMKISRKKDANECPCWERKRAK